MTLLRWLPWALFLLSLGGGGIVGECQHRATVRAEGERDVAREQLATARAELADCRGDFALEQRQTLAAIGAAQRCAIEYATQVTLKDSEIAAKTADAARQRAQLKQCSLKVPEILLDRAGRMWNPR